MFSKSLVSMNECFLDFLIVNSRFGEKNPSYSLLLPQFDQIKPSIVLAKRRGKTFESSLCMKCTCIFLRHTLNGNRRPSIAFVNGVFQEPSG